MPHIFQTTDKSGRKIHLSKERWTHINEEHPEVSEYLEEIQETLKNPTKIKEVDYDEDVRYYYRYFLEISIGKPTKCYAEEVKPGIFLRKDEKTNEVKSVGVVSFKKRSKDMKDIKLDLPIEVNFTALAA